MSDMLKRLHEERTNLLAQARDLNDRAEAEGRDLAGDALAQWDGYMEAIKGVDARMAEVADLEARNRKADEFRAQFEQAAEAREQRAAVADDEAILRSMISGERRAAEFRDLTKGSATAGGNTIRTGFLPQLMEHLTHNSAIRQSRAEVLTTETGETLQVPKTTAHSTAAIIAEGGTITESDPAFAQVSLGAYKYGFSVQISSELEQDTSVDLVAYLARRGGIALGNATGEHYVVGTNSSQPQGVITAATTGVTGGTGVGGAFTTDNLIDLFYSVIPPYRVNGEWLFSDSAVKTARKLKDNDGQYLWQTALTMGEPDMLLGKRVLIDPYVPAVGLGAKSVAFGDMSTFMIRDVRGVRVERSVDFAFQNDLITWRFLFRTDSKQIDATGAIKVFVGGAS